MPMRISGMVSGMDTDAMITALTANYKKKVEQSTHSQTKVTWKKDAYKDLNAKLYNFYSKTLSTARYDSSYNLKKATMSNDVASVTAKNNATNGTYTLSVDKLAQTGYMTGGEIKQYPPVTSASKLAEVRGLEDIVPCSVQIKTSDGMKSISITKDMTMSEFTSKLKEAGVNASFSDTNKRFFISSKASGESNDFEISSDNEDGNLVLQKLGLTKESGAVKIDGSDAQITVNGATFKSSSNNFVVNDLTISATKVSSEPSTVTVSNDTSKVYDKIKDLIKEYNSLMEDFSKAYYADDNSKYYMLSDDEKDKMSEKQVENWEQKIKDSLLRNDSLVGGIMSTMKEVVSKSFGDYSLASLGIGSGSYITTEKSKRGNLLIDGEDNSKNNKLQSALENDMDGVVKFFNDFSKNLYNALDKKIGSSEYSSKFTFYNDKLMDKNYKEYTQKIDKYTEQLTKMEDKYYKQFAAMEKMLSQMNSQTSSLSSLFGMK